MIKQFDVSPPLSHIYPMSNGVLITPETAREMNARAAIARRAKAVQTKNRLKLLDDLLRVAAIPKEPPAAIPTAIPVTVQKMDTTLPDKVDPAREAQVSKIWTQIEKLDELCIAALSVQEVDSSHVERLTRSRDRLFEHWCRLTGVPGAGNRKPAPDRPAPQDRRSIMPIQPAPPAPAASTPTIDDQIGRH